MLALKISARALCLMKWITILISGDEAAQRGEGFAEGGHDQVHLICHAKMGGGTPPSSENAHGMGVIHH